MVILPAQFVKLLNYQGYFVHIGTQEVYSIKSGILRPLAPCTPNYWNNMFDGWLISGGRKGLKIRITREMVKSISTSQVQMNQVVEVGERRRFIKNK